jgi:uncharacterized repeat protein (TIGR03837 family)/translation elongation factor P
MGTHMQWDIFCKVIDNHGDLGVCWRLASQLAVLGERVRLWIDDGTALNWMAPAGCDGVEVIDWSDPVAVRAAVAGPVPDVLIEAFGCEPAPELVARFAAAAAAEGAHRAWINLEYLSAEPYVERLHGLPSPVFKGPGAGLTKRFFYPGFTPATGGLLREPDFAERQAGFDRASWLAAQQIPWKKNERLVSLFCYEPPALSALLAHLAKGPEPTRLLVTAGRAATAVKAHFSNISPENPTLHGHGALSISYLPYLTQPDFDHLLWSCDLNFVRGEDSLVRAVMKIAQEIRAGNVIMHRASPMGRAEDRILRGGRNSATVRMKLKSLLNNQGTEVVFKADDKMDQIVLEKKDCTYSYFADPMYVWMDAEYNQYEVEAENMGDALNYLEDGMPAEVVFYEGKAISVELPTSVEREITWTEPAVKGDTSGKVMKPAKLATGFEVGVPIFVAQGDKVEIDTRTGEYRKRV